MPTLEVFPALPDDRRQHDQGTRAPLGARGARRILEAEPAPGARRHSRIDRRTRVLPVATSSSFHDRELIRAAVRSPSRCVRRPTALRSARAVAASRRCAASYGALPSATARLRCHWPIVDPPQRAAFGSRQELLLRPAEQFEQRRSVECVPRQKVRFGARPARNDSTGRRAGSRRSRICDCRSTRATRAGMAPLCSIVRYEMQRRASSSRGATIAPVGHTVMHALQRPQ